MSLKEIRHQARASLAPVKLKMALISFFCLVFAVGAGVLSIFGVGAILEFLVIPCFAMSMVIFSLNVARKRPVAVADFGKGFAYFAPCVLLNFLNGLFISLWSLLLIVPGIVRSYAYALSFYVLADNPNFSQSEAREESIRLMEDNKLRLFYLQLSMLGWFLLSVLTFGILLFYTIPYYQVATAVFYETVKAEKAPPVYIPIEEINA